MFTVSDVPLGPTTTPTTSFPRQPKASPQQRVCAHHPYNFRAIRENHYDLVSLPILQPCTNGTPHAQR